MFGDMSCLMYQPYASYFPYQRGTSTSSAYQDPLKKFHASLDKVHDSLHTSSAYPGTLGLPTPPSHTSHHPLLAPGGGTPPSSLSVSSSVITKEELIDEKDTHPRDTQFISANCVVFTYVSGDVASNVDEHFSKALSQSNNSYNSDSQSKSQSHWKGSNSNTVPMSQRNFPPSFWNSNYQPPPPTTNTLAGLGGPHDPYSHMTSSLHNMGSFAQDPWRYSFSSHPHHQGHHSAYTHPSLHDLSSYSSATNRFNSQFSSLMPAAAAAGKLSSLTGQYDLHHHSKHHATDPWASASSRYHTDPFCASSSLPTSHHQDPYGLYGGALSGTC